MHPAVATIAQIARTEAASLAPDLPLGKLGLGTSLGLGLLRSALERKFQRKLRPLTWQMTVGQVTAMLDGVETAPEAQPVPLPAGAPPVARAVQPSGPFGGRTRTAPAPAPLALGHGVDIQEIAALPETGGDFATQPFFQEHFSPRELAAAKDRADLRAHLCGLWCAKEAVKKSDPALLALTFAEIELTHDAAGRPLVQLGAPGLGGRFTVAVSISHSAAYAVASAITQRR
jgi:holo-[acyl-carrier protein] synthase